MEHIAHTELVTLGQENNYFLTSFFLIFLLSYLRYFYFCFFSSYPLPLKSFLSPSLLPPVIFVPMLPCAPPPTARAIARTPASPSAVALLTLHARRLRPALPQPRWPYLLRPVPQPRSPPVGHQRLKTSALRPLCSSPAPPPHL